MPSGADEKKYFDIREAPRGLSRLVEERERMYLGERVYRTLNERGHLKEILDSEVMRARAAFRYLVKELQARRYSDREAHARAWQSLVRNWPFALDDGEPEKKAPAEKEPSCWPSVATVTAKNGRRYVLMYQEPMSEDFKRFVRTLQGEPGVHDPAGKRPPGPGGGGVKGPFDESKEKETEPKTKERHRKKQQQRAEQAEQPTPQARGNSPTSHLRRKTAMRKRPSMTK